MTRAVHVNEAKTHPSQFLEDVHAATEIAVAKAGRPVAMLIKSPRGRLIPPALAVGRAARSPLCGRMWTEP